MTNLGPLGMKQYLKDQAKKQVQLERGLGGLLSPSIGIPAPNTAGGVSVDTARSNECERYGNRLVVWHFSYLFTANPAANSVIASLPLGFFPDQSVLFTGWAGVGTGTGVAFLYIKNDGTLCINSSTVQALSVAGAITFTATL